MDRKLPRPITAPPDGNEPAEWRLSERGREAIAMANRMNKTDAGLYASIPIICRGERCKYAERCPLIPMGMEPEGEVCAIEADKVAKLFQRYCTEFDINPDENNFIDLCLIRELIDIDIMLDRANNAIAVDGDIIKDVAVGVTPRGDSITKPELHQGITLKEKLSKKRLDILNKLMATRRDKFEMQKNDNVMQLGAISDILTRAKELGIINDPMIPTIIDVNTIIVDEDGE